MVIINNLEDIIVVRGAGDMATGVIYMLYNAGFKVLALECEKPSSIRRLVSLSECVYKGECTVENMKARKVNNINEIKKALEENIIPVIIDEKMEILEKIKPKILIDAILAKKNLGLNKELADLVIALGPPFQAKKDCHVVIETNRGHDLGRLILDKQASANTNTPSSINGYTKERVIYAQNDGVIKVIKPIKSIVKKGDLLALIDNNEVLATIDGVLRGIISDGYFVKKGLKIADIDPRITEVKNCDTISDKARAIGGATLLAVLKYGGIYER